MILNNNDSKAFIMGSLDVNGGTGVPAAPEPYQFGDYFCINHDLHLCRTEDGTKSSAVIVYRNRINGDYYNQEIDYDNSTTVDVEQSIAAGYLAYSLGAGSNVEFQNVVWASGQWKSYSGYVNNLSKYTDNKLVGNSNELYDRAEGWASFYYNLLYPNNFKLNFDVQPTNENDLRIYVDQNARTYTEGPYMINILDNAGNIITNKEATYHSAGTLGNLLYQEISGLNPGCKYFQFAKLDTATATVTFTDGSTEEYQNINILDANGGILTFPKPGEIFSIRIEIPNGESRTVASIEPHFAINYLTEIPGSTIMYKNPSTIRYEINIERVQKWGEAYPQGFGYNNTEYIFKKTAAEMDPDTLNTEDMVKEYLYDLIHDNA